MGIVRMGASASNNLWKERIRIMTTSALILMITVWILVIGTLTYLFRKLLKKQNEAKQQQAED